MQSCRGKSKAVINPAPYMAGIFETIVYGISREILIRARRGALNRPCRAVVGQYRPPYRKMLLI